MEGNFFVCGEQDAALLNVSFLPLVQVSGSKTCLHIRNP